MDSTSPLSRSEGIVSEPPPAPSPMLDTSFVLWLQQCASPALTTTMRAVTLCGYVPSCLVVAIVCGFRGRLRLGLTLILAIVFADALTIAAKGTFASPRPDAVDPRVHTFGVFESGLSRIATRTSVPADEFGFPSGHVATTAAWALGLAWSRRRSWPIGAAATWVALMALSRMYLGRHFPADVLGGLVVGIAALTLAGVALPSATTGESTLTAGARTALGLSLIVAVALGALAGVGLGPHDAGRFCGLVGASLLLVRSPVLDDAVPSSTRKSRVALALILYGVALWSIAWTVTAGPGLAAMSTMAMSAALHASVLLVPALALGVSAPARPSSSP
jgi:membrane-associated phospholipid phosphatase